jgi:hypothetical protein
MKSKNPSHLKLVDSWDPSEDPEIQSAIKQMVENTPPEKYDELIADFEKELDMVAARRRAENASPIYRKARKNKIRSERAGKLSVKAK